MNQISISDMQRNLHKLDGFDIVEVIDKKKNKIKGYFINSKYALFVEELSIKVSENKKKSKSAAGSLHAYANLELLSQEEGAWQRHLIEKHSK